MALFSLSLRKRQFDKRAGSHVSKRLRDHGEQPCHHWNLITGQDQNRQTSPGQILLIAKLLIGCDEGIELLLGQSQ